MSKPNPEYQISRLLVEQKDYLLECDQEIAANQARVEYYKADKAATERRIKSLEEFLSADSAPLPVAVIVESGGPVKRRNIDLKEAKGEKDDTGNG